jgi:uncharacterized RDD family membrane protein YckC
MSEPTPAGEPPAESPPADPPPADPPPAQRVQWAVPPPAAEVPGAPGLAFADIPARLVAYIVDAFIVGLVGSVAALSLGFGETTVTATASYEWVSATTFSVSFALVGLVYFVYFWTGGRRATIGQRIFDIQVGNAFDGRPLSLDQALGRWVGYGSFIGLLAIVPGLDGFASLAQLIWVLVLLVTSARSPTKRGLHDRFAGTALVRPSSRASSGPAVACLIILVLLGLLLAIAVAAVIILGSQLAPLLQPPDGTI